MASSGKYWIALLDEETKAGKLPVQVLQRLDEDTTNLLSLLGDPKSKESWRKRGLVMGHVQSGKTTNYAAVIAKAIDVGYRNIVVLAGITESLRKQTQERLDRSIVGLSKDRQNVLQRHEVFYHALRNKVLRLRLPICKTTSNLL